MMTGRYEPCVADPLRASCCRLRPTGEVVQGRVSGFILLPQASRLPPYPACNPGMQNAGFTSCIHVENLMNQRQIKSILVCAAIGWLCLLVSCTPATNAGSGGNAESADAAAAAPASGEGQAESKPTDIIDRMFSPLDDAVDDINRDLNKGDADTSSGTNE